jgi:hypothetical protein
MINEVILEGIVINTWTFADDLFFRLASYRDIDQPRKPLNEERDGADYINARLSKGARSLISIHKGQHLRVHGLLQSREFSETLHEFLEKSRSQNRLAEGITVEVKGTTTNDVTIGRNQIEILVNRILVMEPARKNSGSNGSNRRTKEAAEEPATPNE